MRLLRVNAASVFILVFCAASLIGVAVVGKRARPPAGSNAVLATGVFLAKNTAAVYSLWKSAGSSGNIVVHVGSYLHFVSVGIEPGRTYLSPLPMEQLLREYEERLSYRNYLWVAMQAGLVRKIQYVLPPHTYAKKRREYAEGVIPVSLGINSITDANAGALRQIFEKIPEVHSPVLLNIDASYFHDTDDITALARALEQSGLNVTLLTLCLSEDNPDVSGPSREKLMKLAQILLADRFITSLTPVDPGALLEAR